MLSVALVPVSSNRKTGPIAVSTTSSASCPSTCPLIDSGCYAKSGRTRLHWQALDDGKRGGTWQEYINKIDTLERGSMLRHNEAGDLPHVDGYISGGYVRQLTNATKARRIVGFTYTHHLPHLGDNIGVIREANANGFTINLSANDVHQAVEYRKLYNQPTVTVMAMDAPNVQVIDGVKIVACPNEKNPSITCKVCKLCTLPNRDYIIGFRAHGTGKKKAESVANRINTVSIV